MVEWMILTAVHPKKNAAVPGRLSVCGLTLQTVGVQYDVGSALKACIAQLPNGNHGYNHGDRGPVQSRDYGQGITWVIIRVAT